MLRVNEGGPEESKRLVIPGQEACHMVGPGGREGGMPGDGHGAEKGLHFQGFCLLSEVGRDVFSQKPG